MFKKLVTFTGFIIVIGGILITWELYSGYKERQAERIARLQQKVEEVTITTIEGWTVAEIADELERQHLVNKNSFSDALESFDDTSYPLISRPNNSSLEGYLFPDTYRFAKSDSQETIIEKMLSNFSKRLESIGITEPNDSISIPGYEGLSAKGGDGNPGFSLYDIIIMASIIEQESGGKGAVIDPSLSLDDERKLVSGVFYNRLKVGQALESDATVNYATGKNTPAASSKDLEVNSPYNTYKFTGLPPGPICNPSLGSINAALNPQQSDFYYFLHKQPSGKVEFSKTFDEHVRKKLQ